tara:strand:- start:1288 stop:1776 length:489 start_codon:yes stop_codon:yes gene_type:complete
MKNIGRLTTILIIGVCGSLNISYAQESKTSEKIHEMHHQGHNLEKMQERIDLHHGKMMSEIKIRLSISSNQEQGFLKYSEEMKPRIGEYHKHHKEEWSKLSTPEKIDRIQELSITRQAEWKRIGDATKDFYAVLNTDQKKIFDLEFPRFMKAKMHHGHKAHK